MLHGPKLTQARAKQLRQSMTLPEVLLWRALRERPAGLRFRRQHPAGKYVLDFYCPARRLAVEVDGEAHSRGDQPIRDEARDAWLAAQGVRVLRVPAKDVLADLGSVVLHITATCSPAAPYPPPPSAVPLPLRGRNEHTRLGSSSRMLQARPAPDPPPEGEGDHFAAMVEG